MEHWIVSDPGCVRTSNQDAVTVEQLDKNTMLCVVCDGMGGAKSGDVASTLAVDVFTQEVKCSWKSDLDEEAVAQMLHNALKLANFTVYDQSCQFAEFAGMGCTETSLSGMTCCGGIDANLNVLKVFEESMHYDLQDSASFVTPIKAVTDLDGDMSKLSFKDRPIFLAGLSTRKISF